LRISTSGRPVKTPLDQCPPQGAHSIRGSILPPIHNLRERVTRYPDLTGKRLFRELEELGYGGGYTTVTDSRQHRSHATKSARSSHIKSKLFMPQLAPCSSTNPLIAETTNHNLWSRQLETGYSANRHQVRPRLFPLRGQSGRGQPLYLAI
jgi:hypothetical protein